MTHNIALNERMEADVWGVQLLEVWAQIGCSLGFPLLAARWRSCSKHCNTL